MANFLSNPQVSPATPIITYILAMCFEYVLAIDLWLGTFIWWRVVQFSVFYVPMQCGRLAILLASLMFYGIAWVV